MEQAETARELTTVTTVLESPTHGPMLCLGTILESYPPQGGVVPVGNWDWSVVSGQESARGTTWGDYEVVGTWDGQVFTLTRAPRVATGVSPTDPPDTPSAAGTPGPPRSQSELRRIVEDLSTTPGMVTLWSQTRAVRLHVVHDDGTLQRELDERYGAGAVRVVSTLRPYTG